MSDQESKQEPGGEEPSSAGSVDAGQECALCPVCALLQAVSTSRPEVTEHLVAAGRELTRALTALLESHAERGRPSEQRLQRIRVD